MEETDKYEIYVGETLIGVAFLLEVDQPAYICRFEPTPDFEQYRQRFDEYTDAVENPHPGQDIGELWEKHIGELELRLIPFGNVYKGPVFVGKIANGNEAWLTPI